MKNALKHPNFAQDMGLSWSGRRWHHLVPNSEPSSFGGTRPTLCSHTGFVEKNLPQHLRDALESGTEIPVCKRCAFIKERAKP